MQQIQKIGMTLIPCMYTVIDTQHTLSSYNIYKTDPYPYLDRDDATQSMTVRKMLEVKVSILGSVLKEEEISL